VRTAVQLVRQAVAAWSEHNAPSMGAAIAFYTIFSIAPILIIAVGVAGLLLGTDTVRSDLLVQMKSLMGEAGASAVQTLLSNTTYMGKNRLATTVGIGTMLVGATSVFGELQSSLDRIWGTPAKVHVSGTWYFLRSRFLSFGLVLGVGFLLLVSLVISAALAALGTWLSDEIGDWTVILFVIDGILSLTLSTLVFGLVYRFVPRVAIGWEYVWVGGLVTAILFSVGKQAIGLYLGKSAFTSAYGAAGSFVVLLLWVYYSAQIFLFGAEFTRVFASNAEAPERAEA
jgi:membrane protein